MDFPLPVSHSSTGVEGLVYPFLALGTQQERTARTQIGVVDPQLVLNCPIRKSESVMKKCGSSPLPVLENPTSAMHGNNFCKFSGDIIILQVDIDNPHVDTNILHVYMIISHVNINESHVVIIMLHLASMISDTGLRKIFYPY
jgi:hypothetical protein